MGRRLTNVVPIHVRADVVIRTHINTRIHTANLIVDTHMGMHIWTWRAGTRMSTRSQPKGTKRRQ